MADDPKPEVEVEQWAWPEGQKWSFMDTWSQRVLRDTTLSKAAIKVAFRFCFAFNRASGQCWLTIDTISKDVSLSETYVRSAILELIKGGYIIRREKEWVEEANQELRVFYPAARYALGADDARRVRHKPRGGVPKGVDPRTMSRERLREGYSLSVPPGTDCQYPGGTDSQAEGGTDSQYPCNQNVKPEGNPYPESPSERDAGRVQKAYDLDDDLPTPEELRKRR